ncbi:MAG: hypothetical protein WD097_04200 [Balneolales bacterium]
MKADTILLDSVSLVRSPAFSGNLFYFTTGSFDDPVFGSIEAIALLRPSITKQPEDTIGENSTAFLKLNISNIYGHLSDASEFHVVELTRPWRASSWRYDSIPELGTNIVGQFTVQGSDTLNIKLSDDWTNRYRDFYFQEPTELRDSLYRNEMPGLAIIPMHDNGKLFSVNGDEATIIFQSAADTGAVEQDIGSWAVSFSTELEDGEAFGTSQIVYNTFESIMKLDFEITEELLGSNNLSRVELVLYKDTVGMDTGGQFSRPRSETARIYYLMSHDVNYAITTDPRFQANMREDDSSYRINLTNFAHERLFGSSDDRRLYVVIGANDGRILPTLLGGPNDPTRQPKLLITSIETE